jgi:hypothetical protein
MGGAGSLVSVEPDVVMSHSVVFELPDLVEADAFCLAVGAGVLDSVTREGDTWLVEVTLAPETRVLALALRRAEAWLAARGLDGIWFHLDGRTYLLRPAPAGAVAV